MADLPLSDFGVDALTRLVIAEIHGIVDGQNAAKVTAYAVALKYHEEQSGPAPEIPMLGVVHDDAIASAEQERTAWDPAKIVTYVAYVPPPPPAPLPPKPAPLIPVGMFEGHWNGHDYYQVLSNPPDPRPVGAKFSHPVYGWLVKVWIQFPMADGYPLWQTVDAPVVSAVPVAKTA